MLKFQELECGNDPRGWSFAIDAPLYPLLIETKSIHFAEIRPRSVRGNHYHKLRHELIVVMPGAPWEIYWDQGENTPIAVETHEGLRPVLIRVPPLASHAIRNPNSANIYIAAISNHLFTKGDPDTYVRNVCQ